MAKTIIQTIGPLYGEVVNGTVFGRPNGSIFVPSVNTITATLPSEYVTVIPYAGRYFLSVVDSDGVRRGTMNLVAQSQDLANYMAWEFADNADFTDSTVFAGTAGIFNRTYTSLGAVDADFTITGGSTYYLRGVLYSSTGVPVAYSDVFTLTGVAEE